jgi:hypothetical protein
MTYLNVSYVFTYTELIYVYDMYFPQIENTYIDILWTEYRCRYPAPWQRKIARFSQFVQHQDEKEVPPPMFTQTPEKR